MATYVLIHGAADSGWFWHLLEAELRTRVHDVVAPDLPCDDDSAGLAEYTDTVVGAVGDRTGLIVVAQSFGGFTAPLVCDRVPVDLLVLLAGMVPAPGERPEDWLANTGYADARREQAEREGPPPEDDIGLFYHDVPADLAAEALRRGRHQSDTPGRQPWPLPAWPDVPTRFLLCRDDTASSRPSSCAGWRANASASPPTRSTAATASPSAAPPSWPPAWRRSGQCGRGARDQLQPLVVPQDSHTKHEPAGRMRTPQVEQ